MIKYFKCLRVRLLDEKTFMKDIGVDIRILIPIFYPWLIAYFCSEDNSEMQLYVTFFLSYEDKEQQRLLSYSFTWDDNS